MGAQFCGLSGTGFFVAIENVGELIDDFFEDADGGNASGAGFLENVLCVVAGKPLGETVEAGYEEGCVGEEDAPGDDGAGEEGRGGKDDRGDDAPEQEEFAPVDCVINGKGAFDGEDAFTF